ncbi:MAG: hypothetical protein ACREU7_12860 [Burkholderiales bacterium]
MIPLWLKIGYTAIVVVIVAVYLLRYGPGNLLWLSDLGLILAVPTLWLESALLASMLAVGLLLPELLWISSFFGRVITGRRIYGLTDYMFERERPLYLRALSLFHVPLPLLLVWLVHRLGYDPMGLPAFTVIGSIALLMSYRLTDHKENVNRVFGPGNEPQKRVAPLAYLGLLMVAFPLLIYLPTHLALAYFFG